MSKKFSLAALFAVGLLSFMPLAAHAQNAPAAGQDTRSNSGSYDAPQISGGNATVNVPYTPPEPPPPPVMRAREPGDRAERPEAPEHDLEDHETERRSQGEGSGQDEETPEAP